VIEPINLHLSAADTFVKQSERIRAVNHAELGFYKESPDGLPIKYLAHMDADVMPVFSDTLSGVLADTTPVMYLSNKSHESEITAQPELRIVGRGKIGHVDMIIFKRG
jgi:hypothetical protein